MITNLQQLRKDRKESQETIGKLLNVTSQAYSRYERGERELGYEALIKLATHFDVSIDYLLGNSTYYYPDNLLSSEERELVSIFRTLSVSLQNAALNTVRALAGQPAEGNLRKKA